MNSIKRNFTISSSGMQRTPFRPITKTAIN